MNIEQPNVPEQNEFLERLRIAQEKAKEKQEIVIPDISELMPTTKVMKTIKKIIRE